MAWTTDFSPRTVRSDSRSDPYVLGAPRLEDKPTRAVAAYANNRRSWLRAPRSPWRGSREESYEIAIGYALQYRRAVMTDSGVTQAKRALSSRLGRRPLAEVRALQLPHIPEYGWLNAVDRVRRDASLRFGAELRAAEVPTRGEARD